MKKTSTLFLLLFLLVLSVSFVSAKYTDYVDSNTNSNETRIQGIIYFKENNFPAGNASVTIKCHHNGIDNIITVQSLENSGGYFVVFPQSECSSGDLITVSATKDGQSGEEQDIVSDWFTIDSIDIDIGIVYVPLIPEFGLFIGGLTLISAIVTFFIIRKN